MEESEGLYNVDEVQVLSILFEDEQIQWLETDGFSRKAILYKTFFHSVKPNDIITINVTATNLRLGTGGFDIVTAPHSISNSSSLKGHIMKLRYTPLQHSISAIDSPESQYYSFFKNLNKEQSHLEKQFILLAELHSMLPVIWGVVKEVSSSSNMIFIIDDQAALPLAVSHHMQKLHQDNQVSSITIGQAFGGTYEATTLQNALLFAKHYLQADLIIIGVGPGGVGTGTKFGFTGLQQANWANTVGAMNGVPVWIPRISFAEKRSRHYGISHHTLTSLFHFTYAPSLLPFPPLKDKQEKKIKKQISEMEDSHRTIVSHQFKWSKENKTENLLEAALTHYDDHILSMGKSAQEDPSFFLAAVQSTLTSLGRTE